MPTFKIVKRLSIDLPLLDVASLDGRSKAPQLGICKCHVMRS
jgi:hypothetical protein